MITCKKINRMRIKPFRVIISSILFHLLIIVSAFSQSLKNYDKEWKQVNEFVKKDLPKSALEQVKKIYQLAKKDKQDAQVIKSLNLHDHFTKRGYRKR